MTETVQHEHDEINPDHYKAVDGSQVIDVIELYGLDFYIGNAIKYMLRAGRKAYAPAATDLEKAVWYLQRKIQTLSGSPEKESKASAVPLAAAEAKPSAKGPIISGRQSHG